ncbi:MAG: nicotinate (nicotinamide) nucleotide adenylyltransferase [candidate division Zixibacteria bacterium]|nr:nicotinate (nicotinamide) nucleotide adenylyltransferase [candidate division Zixibacteria bacterium]MDH4032844.1 nicotinate (nicotinamide) nucleotide adenylyltransferase [candidate division Zixibacteria bacterium]
MSPDDGGRWGILGGTFDPVHNGHLNLAEQVARNRALNGVLLIPSYRHPFKDDCCATFEHRIKMLQLATVGHAGLMVSDMEKEMDLSGFTVDSIQAIKLRYPQADWSFIIGEDNVADLQHWRSPDLILSQVRILVGERPPHVACDLIGQFPSDRIEMVSINMVDVSSTDIRARLAADASDKSLVPLMPGAVIEHIVEHGLYQ